MPVNIKTTITGLQFLRAFAALTVIFYHAGCVLESFYGITAGHRIFQFGSSGVEIFFVISGFIIWHIHAKDIAQPQRAKVFFWRRFSRIYPTYWLISLAVLLPAILIPGLVKADKLDLGHILESFALIGFGFSHGLPILPPGWSLFHEIKFYLFFLLLILVPRLAGQIFSALAIALTLLMAIFHFFPIPPNPFSQNPFVLFYLSGYNLLFIVGALAAFLYARSQNPSSWKAPLLAGLGIYAALACMDGLAISIDPLARTLGYGVCGFLFVWASCHIPDSTFLNFKFLEQFKFLGDASYSLYLVHWPVFELFARVVRVKSPDIVSASLVFIAMVISGIVAGCVFYVVIERPLMNLLKKIRISAPSDLSRSARVA